MLRVLQDIPVPLSVLSLRIPARFSRVVERALSKTPEERQPSVAALWTELLEGLTPEEVSAAEQTRRMAVCRLRHLVALDASDGSEGATTVIGAAEAVDAGG